MPRSAEDFYDSANPIWSFRVKGSKRDEARIQSLKDKLDGVIKYASLFSAALTLFVFHVNLVHPAQQMVYYQSQVVAPLAQNSKQPPPYPNLPPKSPTVLINALWSLSLFLSLFVALLATLIQQWMWDDMHVFQRYSNPL